MTISLIFPKKRPHKYGREEIKMALKIKKLPHDLTVCKLKNICDIDLGGDLFFIGRTDEEISLVCPTAATPHDTIAREDGWKAFMVEGVLDFSLVGILSDISAVLSECGISIFAVSTYNTDYILVKAESFESALTALSLHGYIVE